MGVAAIGARCAKEEERGFTLVELVVVVALIAFLAGLSASVFDAGGHLAHYRLRAAARELASMMQKARSNAIERNQEWAIVFDTANNAYSLRTKGADLTWATEDDLTDLTVYLGKYKNAIRYGYGKATQDVVGRDSGEEDFADDAVSFAQGDNLNLVVFNSRGLLNSTSGYCYLSNDRGEAYAIGALTSGAIRMRRWAEDEWK
jgi:prepilin-type N-terminal cleavage/methylation domain-containing protein